MKLQDDVDRKRHMRGRLVDEREGVTIASDFLLGPVLGRSRSEDQGFDAVVRGGHAFDAVRGFTRFDYRNLLEGLQRLGCLPREQVLLAPVLADAVQGRGLLDRQGQPPQKVGRE